MSALYVLLQQQVHVTAQKGAKHPKRFKAKAWTSVRTAYDVLVEEDKLKLAQANRAFLDMLEFVPQDEFEAELAEHLADAETGAELTGPQRRALEAAPEPLGLPVPAAVANPFMT